MYCSYSRQEKARKGRTMTVTLPRDIRQQVAESVFTKKDRSLAEKIFREGMILNFVVVVLSSVMTYECFLLDFWWTGGLPVPQPFVPERGVSGRECGLLPKNTCLGWIFFTPQNQVPFPHTHGRLSRSPGSGQSRLSFVILSCVASYGVLY